MDFVEIIMNILNLSGISNLFKTHFERFTDKYEYTGERIKSFIAFLILCLSFLFFTIAILFVLYTILLKRKS